jgi:PEP-CTERM motif
MKFSKLMLLAATAIALPTAANAAITIVQGPSTVLGAFSFSVVGTTITINETWINTNPVFLKIDGLVLGTSYSVIKNITNNSGSTWTSIANELLDPVVDTLDPFPQPTFVPAGYSTSNNSDGLSFDQGGVIPRTSSGFPSINVDELSDARDFIDFFGGAGVANGGVFNVKYGLLDGGSSQGTNQAFLLSQRVNVLSVTPRVPEPATWAMMLVGFGVVGGALRRRARMSISYA